MRRTTIILVSVLIVALVGAGVWFWMNRATIAWPWQAPKTNTNTTTTNTTTNTVAANTNTVLANLPVPVQGTTAATGSLKVGGVTVDVNSLQVFSTYSGVTPAAGKQLLVVFIEPLTPAQATQIAALMSSISLKVGVTSIPMHRYKIATTQVSGDRGFFAFDIPSNTKTAKLVSTIGDATNSVDLTISK